MNEFELIKKYFSKLSNNNHGSLNLNDDVFFDKSKSLVVSVDTYVQGIHFVNFKRPDLVIKKIIRSSISDLICKGVLPKYYFISGSGNNKTFSKKNLKKISSSLKEEQKKYRILLSGGDTVWSKKLSFTITTIGFSKKIIFRNKSKNNDDIYVTGDLGDSYIGLMILKKKLLVKKSLKEYFISKYYLPNLQTKLANKLLNFANSSIDISDGLFDDLEKLINKQKLSYIIKLNKVPVSKYANNLFLKKKKFNKLSIVSNGDDYQVLFTAPPSKSGIISKTSKLLGVKISKIGKICSGSKKSRIYDENGNKITAKLSGYTHQF